MMKNKKQVNLCSKGHYNLAVLDSSGKRVESKCTGEINNVITDNGAYQSLFGGYMFASLQAQIGTGTVEITSTDTGLTNPVKGVTENVTASRASNEVDNGNGTNTLTLTREMSFTLGQQVGTFTEVGVRIPPDDNAPLNLFIAGQLIKDELGNPMSITVLADEQLVITYTLEWTYPNTTTLVGTGSVQDSAGSNYAYEVWVQPYFRNYTLNSARTDTNVNTSGEVAIWEANGTSSAKSATFAQGSNQAGVHDPVAKTLSYTSNLYTLAPTDGKISNAGFIVCWCGDYGNNSSITSPDIALTVPQNEVNGRGGASVAIKFLTPFTKTTNDTFSFQFEYTWAY